MLPSFLRPEVFPYATVEIVPAPVAPVVDRLLADFIALTRAHAAALAADAALDAERTDSPDDEAYGSRCSGVCGFCGMCS